MTNILFLIQFHNLFKLNTVTANIIVPENLYQKVQIKQSHETHLNP